MTKHSRWFASAAVLAAALIGCGGDDDNGGTSGSDGGGGKSGASGNGGTSIEDLPPLLAEKLCAEVEDCLDAPSLDQLFGEAGCEKRLLAQIEDGDFAYIQDAIDADRVKYDGSKVDACLDTFTGLGCGFATERALKNAECRQTFQGTVERGGDCAVDAECKGVSFCKITGECPGKCSALLEAGDPCEKSDQCESGLVCSDEDSTCAAPVAEGDPCGGDVGGTCEPGLSCLGEDTATLKAGTCRTTSELFKGKDGAPCDYDSGMLCEAGLSCIATRAGMAVSLTCAQRVGSGAACHFGAPTQCPDGEYCDADIGAGIVEGQCHALPKAGDACVDIPAAAPCSAGLICDVDQQCHPVNRLGQPCVSDEGCASERCMAGKCVKKTECDL